MVRRLIAIGVGEVLVLAGGAFLLHDTVGFTLPRLTFEMPQVSWTGVLTAFSGGLAAVNWTLVWPAIALVVGLLLLSREWRAGIRSR